MITFLLYIVGLALIGLGFPVDGLPGAALALTGMALLWIGWRRVYLRNRDGAR